MHSLRVLLATCVCFLALGLRVTGQPATGAEAPLFTGKLDNGLRYAVLPHASPKGDISLRLIVHAGALDEREDERGFAHFVEHMAFNGTKRHPPGSLRNYFQRLGVTFGADLNASTSYTHTTYLIDLPDGRAEQLDEALGVLRDYADGLLFPADEVRRESGVVVSELRARDSAARRTAIQMIDTLYAGTPLPNREVGGLPEQLEHATPDTLRAFYQRHYVPERMTVLLVGPVEIDAAAAKIKTAFESIGAPAESTNPAPVPTPARFDGIKPSVIVIPTSKGSTVELTALGPRPADTPEGHREELVQRIASAALAQRLRQRREREDMARYGPPRVGYDAGPAGLYHHTIGLPTTASSWDDAIGIVETELRNARVNGFNQAEVDEAVSAQLASARNRVAEFPSLPAAGVANNVVRFLSSDRRWQTPVADLGETTKALGGLTATEVTASLDAIFPADSLHVVVLAAPDAPPKPDRVQAVYNRSVARAVRARSGDAALRFNYENFGPAGTVAKQDSVEDLGVTRVAFANGVQLNLRPSDLEPERFRLRVVFPVNVASLPHDAGGMADLAGHLLLNSNLKKQKQLELGRLIKLHGITPQFGVNSGTPTLGISGPVAELPFALQFLTALLSELDPDVDRYRVALTLYGSERRQMTINPAPLALREALRVFTGNDSRVLFNYPQRFGSQAAFDETERWLRAHLLDASLEIGLVGDFTADDAIKQAAATVGTLRRRQTPPKPGQPLALPTKASRGEGTAELAASTSLSCVLWPIALPDDPAHNAALALASDVLRDQLLRVLRESLGATYSPTTGLHRDLVQRDFAYASMINTFEPDQARKLTEGSVRLAARLAEKGVTEEEFTRLREPLLTRRTQDLRNNAWWLSIVAVAQSRPAMLDEARQHEKAAAALTVADVNAAAQVFKADRVTAVILRPAAAKAAPASAKKAPGN